MKFKIKCPNCDHSLSLSNPKAGKYKPTCTNCSTRFQIIVELNSNSEEASIRVSRLDEKPPALEETLLTESETTSAAPSISKAALEQTLAQVPNSENSKEKSSIPTSSHTGNLAASKTVENNNADVTLDAIPSHSTSTKQDEVTLDASQSLGLATNNLSPQAKPSSETQKSSPAAMSQKDAPTDNDFSVDDSRIVAGANSEGKGSKTGEVTKLGGYRIVKQIGEGGMGKVYLAKQLSLDRPCAVKTIQASWAANPKAIARFVREAYAAAQLTHHNVVQIYDLGQDAGTSFFSMELVSGGSLDDRVKSKGKLPPKLAATLILQAARGLKFAHDHGMVHRDIKPANLMMTSDGLVKIADMGLIKTSAHDEVSEANDAHSKMLASAKSQVTMAGSSMGTPAYMSPEQAEDAASVDKRADIYSLGCTFYALLTGRPPFDGDTILDVITKHRTEKLQRPEFIVDGLPPRLGDIIEKMTEKLPDDRFQDLEEVIEELEVFLELREDLSNAKIRYYDQRDSRRDDFQQTGSDGDEKPSPKSVAPFDISPEIKNRIQAASAAFQKSPLILIRKLSSIGWFGLSGAMCILFLLLCMWSGLGLVVSGAKSMATSASNALDSVTGSAASGGENSNTNTTQAGNELLTSLVSRFKTSLGFGFAFLIAPAVSVLMSGRDGRSVLALRIRESFLAGGLLNKLFAILAAIAFLFAIHFLSLWFTALFSGLFAIGAGLGYYYGIEKPLGQQRQDAQRQSNEVLKQLRLQGMDESRIQDAFAHNSGKNWEELYEQMFGYEAMRAMRNKWQSQRGPSKLNIDYYRDKLIDRWDLQLTEAKRAHEEKVLAATEKAELVAAGMTLAEAQKKAEAVAASMVDAATETKKAMHELAEGKLTDQAAEAKRQRIKQMLAEARSGKVNSATRSRRVFDAMLGQLLGSKLRFLLSSMLILMAGYWANINRAAIESYWHQAKNTVSQLSIDDGLEKATETAKATLNQTNQNSWQPIFGGLVNHQNVLFLVAAGLILGVGTLFHGWKISLLIIPAALAVLAVPLVFF
ncbi:MAG: protein kinase [Pirellulales bacterium]